MGDAGASALAAALDRGALPRLEASLWATPPSATRRWRPSRRPCGGGPRWSLSASVATRSATRASPPSWRRRRLAGTPPPPAGGLKKLQVLDLDYTQITDAGCATLAAALDSGALPALQELELEGTRVSVAATQAVHEAMERIYRARGYGDSGGGGDDDDEAEADVDVSSA